jgi:hypothetical protein
MRIYKKSGSLVRPDPKFGTKLAITDIVDWLIGCKYGFIPYLQNNWTLHVLTIVTFLNYDYNLPNQPFNQ